MAGPQKSKSENQSATGGARRKTYFKIASLHKHVPFSCVFVIAGYAYYVLSTVISHVIFDIHIYETYTYDAYVICILYISHI